jgi:ubiquinone/menaquinone biosynthesis C-methylase UbiE
MPELYDRIGVGYHAQRRPDSALAVQASATALPFRAGAFEAALAVLTVHHWPDRAGGLAELRRVARARDALDLGYRLVIARGPGAA